MSNTKRNNVEQTVSAIPRWLTETDVSEMLSVCLSKLRQDRFYRRGLPYYKWGKTVRYKLSDVLAFMEPRRVCPE